MKNLNEALLWRAAIKDYKKDVVLSENEVHELLESARLAPSSYGLQPYKVLVIENKEVREKLRAASYNQAQVTDASHFIVFASRTDENEADVLEYVKRISEVRGIPEESLDSYKGMMNGALSSMSEEGKKAWAAKQAYLALGFLLSAAALAEIDATPMEGFDAKAYDDILGLSGTGYTASVICSLGKRAETDVYSKMPKVRKNEEAFIVKIS